MKLTDITVSSSRFAGNGPFKQCTCRCSRQTRSAGEVHGIRKWMHIPQTVYAIDVLFQCIGKHCTIESIKEKLLLYPELPSGRFVPVFPITSSSLTRGCGGLWVSPLPVVALRPLHCKPGKGCVNGRPKETLCVYDFYESRDGVIIYVMATRSQLRQEM